MSRGIHTSPNKGETTTWLTPLDLKKSLGKFDIDPCCPPEMPWRTAEVMISNSKPVVAPVIFGNGLDVEWKGRVWLNPPYGENEKWLHKLYENGNGIALLASRTEVVKWFFPYVWEKADAVLFIRGRLYYYKPDGTRGKSNAGHGSVLVAYGQNNVDALKNIKHKGQFLSNWER